METAFRTFFHLSALALTLLACDPATPVGGATATSTPVDSAAAETPDTTARLADIRAEYTRLEDLRQSNRVRIDSLGYECEELAGFFRFYYRGDTLLMAEREYVAGDHHGGVERYYFQHNTPLFTFQQESSWQFTGEERAGPDGAPIAITRDDIHEVRTYYTAGGQPFRYRYKDYSLHSDRENPDPESILNRPDGTGVVNALGPYALRLVAQRDSVDCALVR